MKKKKKNIKKAPVKFREDLLYFQHFMLKVVVITDLGQRQKSA